MLGAMKEVLCDAVPLFANIIAILQSKSCKAVSKGVTTHSFSVLPISQGAVDRGSLDTA